ncbi:MAG: hypothetical protein K6D97_04670 [Clostridia bacterium]|nr:hypothetical protein [Clostridia bacterium]
MEKFTVIFVDDDNKTVLETQEVERGASVSYNGSQTEKTIENRSYTLVGWIGEEKMNDVQSNLTLIAKYEPVIMENHEQTPEEALYEATVNSTQNIRLSATVQAGNKVVSQEEATRNASRLKLVERILRDGSVVIDTSALGKDANDVGEAR